MIKPLNKYVVCKRKAEDKPKSVIIELGEQTDYKFEVIAISDEVTCVCVGESIYMPAYNRHKIEIKGEELFIMQSDQIIAKYV